MSSQVSTQFGLPIDMSAKMGGLQAIAGALNAGELARAQIATVLLGIPDPPQLFKGAAAPEQAIKLIRDLHWSGLLKWDPDEHPRWPSGQSDGGQFRPVTGDTDSHTNPTQGSRPSDQKAGGFWPDLASTLAAGAVEVAGNIAIGAEELGTEGAATPLVPAEEAGLSALAGEAASAAAGMVESGEAKAVSESAIDYAEGSFSIRDWSGYPTNLSRPTGPFRLLNGDEYDAARAAANSANRALREADPPEYAGREIHEIQPVKFGGSPTDPANKMVLAPEDHSVVTTWWARLNRSFPK
ncbi:MAG TPA: hypothetical protein VHU23_13095 [Rhizomicrobium sp.]|nr:hypothetical protein [Rhizomicrobium sp.]